MNYDVARVLFAFQFRVLAFIIIYILLELKSTVLKVFGEGKPFFSIFIGAMNAEHS